MDTDNNLFREFPPISREEWEKAIKEDLRGGDYRIKLRWQTGEGIEAMPFYRADDLETKPSPLTGQRSSWEIRQPIAEQDITEANAIAKEAIENGADALQFALSVQQAEDKSGGELRGTAVQDQAAFNGLLDAIDLTETAIHFDSGAAAPIVVAMIHNEAESRSMDSASVSASVLYDPYALALTAGRTEDEQMIVEKARHMVQFCSNHLPNVRCLGVDARTYHNVGATIVQELGYALATGSEYLATLSEAGLDIGTIAAGIHFNFSIGSNYFLEIAKFRSARKLWRTVLNAYKVDDVHHVYLHASSSSWNKTIYDPYVNMLRSTTEGMSAAIAGCDAITLQPFDAAFRRPDAFSRRIARNSQIILKEEAYLDKVADAAAGSYYIETLTDTIAEAAWECFCEVEKEGGMMQSIRSGYVQAAIEESRNERDRSIAKRGRIFVGTNQYPNADDRMPEEAETRESAVSLKQTDTDADIDRKTLFPSLKNALKEASTVGDLMPVITGSNEEVIRQVPEYRGAKAFEELRKATEDHAKTPTVLILPLGPRKMRKARATFAANFFGCAGYQMENPVGFESVDYAIKAVRDSKPDIVVLCSADEAYEELVPEVCGALGEEKQQPITVIAGDPKEHIERYRNAGIDVFIHAKSNVLETLREFQRELGVIES